VPEEVHIHVHVHTGGTSEEHTQILDAVQELTEGVASMAADLSGLTNEVSEQETTVAGAVALINGFGAQLDELLQQAEEGRVDVAAISALKDRLDASTNSLAEAVTANTPESPEEPPVEEPPVEEPPVEEPPVDEEPAPPVEGNVNP
jgi:ABC-type transporter Mla subunit MlaD